MDKRCHQFVAGTGKPPFHCSGVTFLALDARPSATLHPMGPARNSMKPGASTIHQKTHTISSKVDANQLTPTPKWFQPWHQNGPKPGTKMDPNLAPKCTQPSHQNGSNSGTKMDPNPAPKWTQTWHQNGPNTGPKWLQPWHQNDPKPGTKMNSTLAPK